MAKPVITVTQTTEEYRDDDKYHHSIRTIDATTTKFQTKGITKTESLIYDTGEDHYSGYEADGFTASFGYSDTVWDLTSNIRIIDPTNPHAPTITKVETVGSLFEESEFTVLQFYTDDDGVYHEDIILHEFSSGTTLINTNATTVTHAVDFMG